MSTATVGAGLTRLLRLRRPGITGFSGIEVGEDWIRCARQNRRGQDMDWSLADLRFAAPDVAGDDSSRESESGSNDGDLRDAAREAGIPRGPAVCALNSPHLETLPLSLKPSRSILWMSS